MILTANCTQINASYCTQFGENRETKSAVVKTRELRIRKIGSLKTEIIRPQQKFKVHFFR